MSQQNNSKRDRGGLWMILLWLLMILTVFYKIIPWLTDLFYNAQRALEETRSALQIEKEYMPKIREKYKTDKGTVPSWVKSKAYVGIANEIAWNLAEDEKLWWWERIWTYPWKARDLLMGMHYEEELAAIDLHLRKITRTKIGLYEIINARLREEDKQALKKHNPKLWTPYIDYGILPEFNNQGG